jgi:fumarate hydratase class II
LLAGTGTSVHQKNLIKMSDYRIEKDSMGEVKVPVNALYGAQTQRAHDNFPISGIKFSREFIEALGYVKKAAALANNSLGLVDSGRAEAINAAAQEVIDGQHDAQFVIDIFQTGSGTSSNMNANEVISHIANAHIEEAENKVHPNDHVNFGQSSNDVVPTAIRISAVLAATKQLIPALIHLKETFLAKGAEYADVVKTGRTHLMDAMPVTIEQEFGGYARQIELGIVRVQSALERVRELPQGGTAVGTGINTHHDFGKLFAERVSALTGEQFVEALNHFEAQATVDAPVELSSQLKTVAVSLMKIYDKS